MTNEPTLPPPTTYESVVREVDPGCHVYRTIVTGSRRFLGFAGLGGTAFLVWMGRNFATGLSADAFGYGVGALFWLLSLVLLYGSITVVSYSTRVEITPKAVRIVRRWYTFERNDVAVWDIRRFVGAEVHKQIRVSMGPGVHGPSLYGVQLVQHNGLGVSLQSTIASLDAARALAADITESIRQAVEQPDGLGAPTLQAAR